MTGLRIDKTAGDFTGISARARPSQTVKKGRVSGWFGDGCRRKMRRRFQGSEVRLTDSAVSLNSGQVWPLATLLGTTCC